MKRVSLTVRVEPALARDFKAVAALNGVSMNEIFIEAINKYLKDKRKK